jgi:proline-serine-threonine phosphatase interacting protein 1
MGSLNPRHLSSATQGTDFTSTAGFDTLHQRMKDAKQFTDDVATFMRQRCGHDCETDPEINYERRLHFSQPSHIPILRPLQNHSALIEETYAKSLMKLAKNAGGAMEIGYAVTLSIPHTIHTTTPSIYAS